MAPPLEAGSRSALALVAWLGVFVGADGSINSGKMVATDPTHLSLPPSSAEPTGQPGTTFLNTDTIEVVYLKTDGTPVGFSLNNTRHYRSVLISLTSDHGMLSLEVASPQWPYPNKTTARNPGIVARVHMWDQPVIIKVSLKGGTGNITYNTASIIEAQLVATGYNLDSPVPGGCAMDSPWVVANPTLNIRQSDLYSVDMHIAPADLSPSITLGARHVAHVYTTCDVADAPQEIVYNDSEPLGSMLSYQLYSHYISDCGSAYKKVFDDLALMQAVDKMNSLDDVLSNGHLEATAPLPKQKPIKFSLDIIAGQGVVYNVVVTDDRAWAVAQDHPELYPGKTKKDFQAAYAPFATYHCSRNFRADCSTIPGTGPWCNALDECSWHEGTKTCKNNEFFPDCDNLVDWHIMIFEVLIGLLGLFIALFGHKYFRCEIGIFGTFFFGAVGYIAAFTDSISEPARLGIAAASGMAGAFVMVYFWFISRGTAIVLVFVGTILGIFIANFIFATQLAEYDLWRNSFNFWMAYACLVLIWPILLLLRDRFGNILATSVVGSYCFLFGVDFFVASSFDDMLVNAFKRATVPSFSVDYSGNYFADAFNGCSDVALNTVMLVLWITLSGISFMVQWSYFRGKHNSVPASNREDWHFWTGLFSDSYLSYSLHSQPTAAASGGTWLQRRRAAMRRSRNRDECQDNHLENNFDRPLMSVGAPEFSRRYSVNVAVTPAPVYEDEDDVAMLTPQVPVVHQAAYPTNSGTRGGERDVGRDVGPLGPLPGPGPAFAAAGRRQRARKKKKPAQPSMPSMGNDGGLFDTDDDDELLLAPVPSSRRSTTTHPPEPGAATND